MTNAQKPARRTKNKIPQLIPHPQMPSAITPAQYQQYIRTGKLPGPGLFSRMVPPLPATFMPLEVGSVYEHPTRPGYLIVVLVSNPGGYLVSTPDGQEQLHYDALGYCLVMDPLLPQYRLVQSLSQSL